MTVVFLFNSAQFSCAVYCMCVCFYICCIWRNKLYLLHFLYIYYYIYYYIYCYNYSASQPPTSNTHDRSSSTMYVEDIINSVANATDIHDNDGNASDRGDSDVNKQISDLKQTINVVNRLSVIDVSYR